MARDRAAPYLAVYQVLEEAAFAQTVPAGGRGTIYSAIDQLRAEAAPQEHVDLAARIGLALHRLWDARRSSDSDVIENAMAELQAAGAAWLQTPLHTGWC